VQNRGLHRRVSTAAVSRLANVRAATGAEGLSCFRDSAGLHGHPRAIASVAKRSPDVGAAAPLLRRRSARRPEVAKRAKAIAGKMRRFRALRSAIPTDLAKLLDDYGRKKFNRSAGLNLEPATHELVASIMMPKPAEEWLPLIEAIRETGVRRGGWTACGGWEVLFANFLSPVPDSILDELSEVRVRFLLTLDRPNTGAFMNSMGHDYAQEDRSGDVRATFAVLTSAAKAVASLTRGSTSSRSFARAPSA
jgi:hypothetical protein